MPLRRKVFKTVTSNELIAPGEAVVSVAASDTGSALKRVERRLKGDTEWIRSNTNLFRNAHQGCDAAGLQRSSPLARRRNTSILGQCNTSRLVPEDYVVGAASWNTI